MSNKEQTKAQLLKALYEGTKEEAQTALDAWFEAREVLKGSEYEHE